MYYLDQPTWTPLIRDTQLELYLSEIEDELLKINEDRKNYHNLSNEELSALQDLMKDKNIIIKPADKGSVIAIWDRDDYLLPKIHKRTFNVPGRPVVSNIGTGTENISAFLDFNPSLIYWRALEIF